MKLNDAGLLDVAAWKAAEVRLPAFDRKKMAEETAKAPTWVHFGAGNIFRGFIENLQQALLEKGLVKSGIVAADTFDFDIIDKIYKPFDNMTLLVTLQPDGSMKKEVVAAVGEALRAGNDFPEDMKELRRIFEASSLQMVSFTITEKGYALADMNGKFFPFVEADFKNGPGKCSHALSVLTSLLLARFEAGKTPIAVVSMDNCSHNGEKLRASVMTVADKWHENGFVSDEFIAWIKDEAKVSFPWTMIDKITPRPAKSVEEELSKAGIEDMAPIITSKKTFIAPFVNAEPSQYLVVEDRFPNGRAPLEKAGVYFADRQTVNDTERMKVTTCLNPLHTALAVYGCLLGYESIAAEMRDKELKALVEKIGYLEGMPVVTDPKIFAPEDFIHEVVEKRLPNPFIPDTPQRIATDTSQKIPVRFGETIKSYVARDDLDVSSLTFIPLAIAGWLRYLIEVDDKGEKMECSADPMLETLKAQLAGIEFGKPESAKGRISPMLTNEVLFGSDLCALGMDKKIEDMFAQMLAGPGAVRSTLKKYLD